ncbi:MAG TPA: hypothetical protein VNG33_13475 [Polyangiaceae bacterium]|nr:hypothetical protein [Polyangiaceae bacterium]
MTRSFTVLLLLLPCFGCAGLLGADFDDKELCNVDCDINAAVTGQPHVLASAQDALGAIAAQGSAVFWTDGYPSQSGGRIVTCADVACQDGPRTLASQQEGPRGLAVDEARLYWATGNGAIVSCPREGCVDTGPSVLVTEENPAEAVAVDAERIYWTEDGHYNYDPGRVMSCALGGCPAGPTLLADGQSGAKLIAAGGGYVAWANAGTGDAGQSVRACPGDGCNGEPTLIASSPAEVGGIAISGGKVYWSLQSGSGSTVFGKILSCAVTGCQDSPKTLVSTATRPQGLALDSDNLYFADPYEKTVRKCRIADCPNGSTVIAGVGNASDIPPGLLNPSELALSGSDVFWTSPGDGVVATHVK